MNLSWEPCPGNEVTQNVHKASHGARQCPSTWMSSHEAHGTALFRRWTCGSVLETRSTGGTAEPFPGKPGGGKPDPTSNWLAGIRSVDSQLSCPPR